MSGTQYQVAAQCDIHVLVGDATKKANISSGFIGTYARPTVYAFVHKQSAAPHRRTDRQADVQINRRTDG